MGFLLQCMEGSPFRNTWPNVPPIRILGRFPGVTISKYSDHTSAARSMIHASPPLTVYYGASALEQLGVSMLHDTGSWRWVQPRAPQWGEPSTPQPTWTRRNMAEVIEERRMIWLPSGHWQEERGSVKIQKLRSSIWSITPLFIQLCPSTTQPCQ